MPRSAAERFKPTVFERLKQSMEAKLKRKEPPPKAAKSKPKSFPQPGETFKGQTVINTERTPVSEAIRTREVIRFADMHETQIRETTYRRAVNNAVWSKWGTITSSSTLCNTYATTNIWNEWILDTRTTAVTDSWVHWNDLGCDARTGYSIGSGIGDAFRQSQPRIQVAESEEMKKLRLEREAKWKAEQEVYRLEALAAQKRREEANERAMALLYSCMSKEQQEMLKELNFFYVTAKSGRKYRIDRGTHGNVKVVDKDNRVIERLCIQPNGVPLGDSMLAQKLLIETAEDVFRKHANITLNNGQIIYAPNKDLLTGDKLAPAINIFTKEAIQQSSQPIARVG